ncbi:MAG: MBL fold metallo-hydrolase [Gammaproteobacteria bacterium]|nr:MBL fold metallo-hydrolase [Gammaproteobacteria bacterium]
MPAAATIDIGSGIVAVDTEYQRPLQDASHLIVEEGRAAFVDTGTNDSVPLLLDALRQADIDAANVDFVFLTHVHLDHAGGAGNLMRELPNARCVLHPRGAPHMVNPEKLIKGTEGVYGVERTREMYGELQPIDEHRVLVVNDGQWLDVNGRNVQALFTEGHARHHYCLNDPASRGVFTGDSFGVSYRELDTAAGEFIFPTSTPASFDPVEAHIAIDRIMACEPQQLYLTHYSRVNDVERLAEDMHAGITAYEKMALDCSDEKDRGAALREAMFDYLSQSALAHGFQGSAEVLAEIIGVDAELNAAGLLAWLNRLDKGK